MSLGTTQTAVCSLSCARIVTRWLSIERIVSSGNWAGGTKIVAWFCGKAKWRILPVSSWGG
jgi:hypothetical protein